MERLLNDKEVLQIIGPKSKMLTYPEIFQYRTIDELFGDCDKIVLLYVNKMHGDSIVGHWCLLTKVKRGKKTIIEFNDPYGLMPDEAMEFYTKKWKIEIFKTQKYEVSKFRGESRKKPEKKKEIKEKK